APLRLPCRAVFSNRTMDSREAGRGRRSVADPMTDRASCAALTPAPAPARPTVLSGPSGVGKSRVWARLRRASPQVWLSVSVTTRAPRPGEADGHEYYFITEPEFQRQVRDGELLEWASFAGNWDGTPPAPVLDRNGAGHAVAA